jgi:hypothetical protein
VQVTNIHVGEWEHVLVSNLKKFVPQSVQDTFHEWRGAMKKTEHDSTGSEHVSDAVEMAGWGVEEAEKKHKAEASMSRPYTRPFPFLSHNEAHHTSTTPVYKSPPQAF